MAAGGKSFADNVANGERYLERFARDGVQHFIDGAAVPARSGRTFETSSPHDGRVLARVAQGDAADVGAAAAAAEGAFPKWRAVPGAERRDLLHAIADAIEARADEIAVLESLDTGQAIRFMSAAAKRGAENFRFFADKAPEAEQGLSLPAREHVNYTLRQPIGPVAAITPWNTPFMLATWKIAPALAAGCTVVHKPAEWSPITASVLAEIAHAAGLPAGVLNTVHGFGETAGKAATEHPAIRAVAFVGESATGSAIMAQAAPTL
ncbi:MAG TPA: aldehyde dehydrogenase family protein, partial [Gammaproteobacteria bacterium]|nr:aldehyde dehydrogenase family protein [Gammaproteobacteria bacterium]